MSTLHTLNQSPANTEIWSRLCLAIETGDSLLLFENGVYYLSHPRLEALTTLATPPHLYVLAPDARARGLEQASHLPVEFIDYPRFVSLSCENDKVIAWY